MEKVFAEVGFGNDSFASTEIENGDNEYRVAAFVKPSVVSGYYIRIWIFKHVYILSTNAGFSVTKKEKNKLKILIGISGTR